MKPWRIAALTEPPLDVMADLYCAIYSFFSKRVGNLKFAWSHINANNLTALIVVIYEQKIK